MRYPSLLAVGCVAALVGAGATWAGNAVAAQVSAVSAAQLAVGRQVLAANDGWASATTGTTGGSTATDANVFVASSRAELVSALTGTAPKIVYISGSINANEDDSRALMTCDQYAAGTGYTQAAYLAAYDPAVWGLTTKVSGAQEDARAAAAANQAAHIQIRVPSNTTIIGLGNTAEFIGGTLLLSKSDNVIIRNVKFADAADCFPQWDPTDNDPAPAPPGNWNSDYDNVSLSGATHVWIDHNTFTDQPNPDSAQPVLFNRPVQVHDGATDITQASDYVTVSWNSYSDHDKTQLIGSSNSSTADPGHLRVTLHHNSYTNILQRSPRVRFGQVDVYNNYYSVLDQSPTVEKFVYSLGVGKSSAIYAEKNFYALGVGYAASSIIYNWSGTAVTTTDNWVKLGAAPAAAVDLVAAFNAANPTAVLGTDAGWTPTLRTHVDTALDVQTLVPAGVGVGKLGA